HADGSFSYHADSNFNGSDSFTYKANDGALDSTAATVTITVNPVNDAPVAANDAYSIDEAPTLTVATPPVLTNDSDLDRDSLTAVRVPATTTLVPSTTLFRSHADGSFSYHADSNFNGSDSFTYKANDGALDSTAATVTITVNPVNDAPVAANDAY